MRTMHTNIQRKLKNHVHLLTQNNRGKHTSQEIWVLPVGWWILASHS